MLILVARLCFGGLSILAEERFRSSRIIDRVGWSRILCDRGYRFGDLEREMDALLAEVNKDFYHFLAETGL